MDYPPFLSNDRMLPGSLLFPSHSLIITSCRTWIKVLTYYVYVESHRALDMEHNSVVLLKTNTHLQNTHTELVCSVCTKILPAFRDSLERRNWGREVSIKWSCQVLVIFICSDWKRISGRGNIKTYFRIQIGLDKWQFFMEISIEKDFLQVALPEIRYQQKVKWESVCKDKLKRDYMHTNRGAKKIKSSKISASAVWMMMMLWEITHENFKSHQLFIRRLEWRRKLD